MSVDIRYGAFSFLGSGFPIPFVSRETDVIYYTDKHAQVTRITLDGVVIGTFAEIDAARNTILSNFSSDFSNLTIEENAVVRASFERCIVQGVDFAPANFGQASYSIKLECYEQALFSATFGVLDPSNSFSFSEQDNGIVQITHSISARGFSTSLAPIVNAKNFVQSLGGYSVNDLAPAFLNGIADANVILTSVSRNVNTTTSTYSEEEVYLVQTGSIDVTPLFQGVVSEISSSVSNDIKEPFTRVEVNFSIIGHKNSTEANLRNNMPSASTLLRIAERALGSSLINPIPLTYNVDDQAGTVKRISVKASYNTDIISNADNAYFDYSVDFSTDHVTDITTASINGEIKAKGNVAKKYLAASNFYSSILASTQKLSGYLYDRTNVTYLAAIGSDWPLKPIFDSISVSEDKFKGVISLQASFSNEDFFVGCTKAQYNLDVTPQVAKFSSVAGNNAVGLYGVFDLNAFNMEELSLKLELVASEAYKNFPNVFLNNLTSLIYDLERDVIMDNKTANGQATKVQESSTTGVYPNLNANYSSGYKVQKNSYFS